MATSFSERIKELRNDKNLNQAEFAKLIKTNQSTLSAYENGDRFPPYETLLCIAQQCQVSLDWLCGLSETKGQNNEIRTYTDLIRTIMSLRQSPSIDISFKTEEHLPPHPVDTPYSTVICEINDKHFLKFFQEWEDILSVCKKSPSGDKIMRIWLQDTFETYDFALEHSPYRFITDFHMDDELPF